MNAVWHRRPWPQEMQTWCNAGCKWCSKSFYSKSIHYCAKRDRIPHNTLITVNHSKHDFQLTLFPSTFSWAWWSFVTPFTWLTWLLPDQGHTNGPMSHPLQASGEERFHLHVHKKQNSSLRFQCSATCVPLADSVVPNTHRFSAISVTVVRFCGWWMIQY